MGKVVVAGGSGFIGRAVVAVALESGHEAVVLSRSGRAVAGARGVQWDGATLGSWASELEGAAGVVNLAGESVLKRWTPAHRKAMHASRIGPTRLIGEAVAACSEPPKAWVNASAIGWYGDTGQREVSEASPAAQDETAALCRDWEAAVDEAVTPSTRKVKVRIGLVLGNEAGALPMLTKVTKAFLGGPLGDGSDYKSWIHVRDLARMVVWAIESDVVGPINGTAPNPVTEADFMAALRAALGRPPVPPAHPFVAEALSGVLGIPKHVLLAGCRVVPAIPLARGFQFEFPTVESALADLLDDVPSAWLPRTA
jgi:uncharacterized protein